MEPVDHVYCFPRFKTEMDFEKFFQLKEIEPKAKKVIVEAKSTNGYVVVLDEYMDKVFPNLEEIEFKNPSFITDDVLEEFQRIACRKNLKFINACNVSMLGISFGSIGEVFKEFPNSELEQKLVFYPENLGLTSFSQSSFLRWFFVSKDTHERYYKMKKEPNLQ